MSRIGKAPVKIASGVEVELLEREIIVKGKLGELRSAFTDQVIVSKEAGEGDEGDFISVKPANDTTVARSMWGTTRSIISNMVVGVSEGFTKRLEIDGVGYRASTDGKVITLILGYSHEIKYALPSGVDVKCEKPTLLVISGPNKQLVGQVAGELKKLRPVEPYKGKGVKEEGQYVRRKEGKKK